MVLAPSVVFGGSIFLNPSVSADNHTAHLCWTCLCSPDLQPSQKTQDAGKTQTEDEKLQEDCRAIEMTEPASRPGVQGPI